MEGYKIRKFVNGREVDKLTEEQKKLFALTALKAIGAKEKKAR